MNNPIKFQQDFQGTQTRVSLAGDMNEDSDYSGIVVEKSAEIVFDMEGITLINSSGIQKWILFMQRIPNTSKVYFDKCPVRVIYQINLFPSFTAGKAVDIRSFYAPYYCEGEDKNYSVLLETDKFFPPGVEPKAPEMKSPSTGQPMEFDAIEKKFFLFLKRGK